MSKKANPGVIGAFVLGAIALLALAIVVFGSGRFFRDTTELVAFFPGSVKGLRVGAPVNFRGVRIGEVTDIKVVFESETVEARIPVIFELDDAQIIDVGRDDSMEQEDFRERLFAEGFRAQLDLDSFVTGLLSVNLDFLPNAPPPVFFNGEMIHVDCIEVPTVPSNLQQLEANAQTIAKELSDALTSVNTLLSDVSAGAERNRDRIDKLIVDIAGVADALNSARPLIRGLIEDGASALASFNQTATTINTLVERNADDINTTLQQLSENIAAFGRMADQVNNMVAENRSGLRDFSQTGLYEFTGLAKDAQRMADQITRVMEQLERDPSRFLFGDRTGSGIQAR